ncbi:transglycosylase domain-containing protein [Facklamia sp. P12945]|uniref:transglycosylase domain-containing protein n=1 Tax=unclassified Facklamia TaxID=2622293 RepID=UPI003D176DF0
MEKFKMQSSKHKIFQGIKNIWRYYRGWKWLVFIALSLTLFLTSYLVFIAKTTDVKQLQDSLQTKTEIYDKQDQYVGTLLSQKGSYVTLDEISPLMQETVVKTEDKRFYDHNGFDTIGIGRAFLRLVINRNTSGGGGSTLTQQLAKNAFLSLDQTFQRKLKELFLALEIEKTYSKDQILEMYLNNAYFGNGVWGIQDAAQKYFGINAYQLDQNQSMVLTGILKGPSLYNPIDDYQAAIDRRNVIADLLADEGVISFSNAEDYKAMSIPLLDNYVPASSGHEYPFYFDAVINEAIRKVNIPEEDLMSKGYRIYTNLDINAQQGLNNAYQENAYLFNDGAYDAPIVQSASAIVDTRTGGIMAIYGGRGEYVYRGFNRASDMYRAPGSTIKPLAVYLPALENGFNMHSMVPDVVKAYGKDQFAPENFNRQTDPRGEVPLYYALSQSKNTSAVYLLDKLGIQTAVDKLHQFGIEVPQQDQQLTLALGAFSTGVSPVQLASAYATFANKGIRNESYFIRRIEDISGKVVYDNEKPKRHLIMTKTIAADMTSMMLDTYGGNGTGYGAGPNTGLIAGKTGTTEVSDGSTQTRDRWMVGYTPDFAIATWIGLDDVESANLDEIMPTGMGRLFNSQTSYMMAYSPQTPFDVSYASQMEADTNGKMGGDWLENVDFNFDGELFSTLKENGSNLWEKVKSFSSEKTQEVINWIENLDLPI